jgi:hypothetical protein
VADLVAYDVLRGLDHLRDAGHDPTDERIAEAVSVVESKHDADGRWPLEQIHEQGASYFEMEAGEGSPSRWITLLALRVLGWKREGGQA